MKPSATRPGHVIPTDGAGLVRFTSGFGVESEPWSDPVAE